MLIRKNVWGLDQCVGVSPGAAAGFGPYGTGTGIRFKEPTALSMLEELQCMQDTSQWNARVDDILVRISTSACVSLSLARPVSLALARFLSLLSSLGLSVCLCVSMCVYSCLCVRFS